MKKTIQSRFTAVQLDEVAQSVMKHLSYACLSVELKCGDDEVTVTYNPIIQMRRLGVFGQTKVNLVDEKIAWLVLNGFIKPRKNEKWNSIEKNVTVNGVPVNLRTI